MQKKIGIRTNSTPDILIPLSSVSVGYCFKFSQYSSTCMRVQLNNLNIEFVNLESGCITSLCRTDDYNTQVISLPNAYFMEE